MDDRVILPDDRQISRAKTKLGLKKDQNLTTLMLEANAKKPRAAQTLSPNASERHDARKRAEKIEKLLSPAAELSPEEAYQKELDAKAAASAKMQSLTKEAQANVDRIVADNQSALFANVPVMDYDPAANDLTAEGILAKIQNNAELKAALGGIKAAYEKEVAASQPDTGTRDARWTDAENSRFSELRSIKAGDLTDAEFKELRDLQRKA
jgi:hypothetical protein